MRTSIRSALACAAAVLIACTPEPKKLRLKVGEVCRQSADCFSSHCELAADAPKNNPNLRVCCNVECTKNSRCDGAYCRPTCVGEGCPTSLSELGAACDFSSDCASGYCEPDQSGGLQCCEDDCSALGLACRYGACDCPAGYTTSPNSGTCVPLEEVEGFDDLDLDGRMVSLGDGGPGTTNPDPGIVFPGGENSENELPIVAGEDPDGGPGGALPACGNGRTDAREECDGQLACTYECLLAKCGNNRLDPGEECEPPSTAACSEHCLALGCGNGRLEDGEECDPPLAGSCDEHCLIPKCGNQRVDGDEECDPPAAGRCDSKCREIQCGNRRVEDGEGCDPPLSGVCDDTCRPIGCGDAVEKGSEECDPPEWGVCSGDCKDIVCGNDRVDESEECDPPTVGSCDETCHSIECGNNRVDEGEECDPPTPGWCSTDCQNIDCGNQRIDQGEACEPEGPSDPSCSTLCTPIEGNTITISAFDQSTEAWRLRMAAPDSLLMTSTVRHSNDDGYPKPGSMLITAGFDAPGQKLEGSLRLKSPIDVSGYLIIARVRLESGLARTGRPGAIKLFAKSGPSLDYASGPWVELAPASEWLGVALDPANPMLQPDNFDPRDVREVGLEVATFADSTLVESAELYVDSVVLAH